MPITVMPLRTAHFTTEGQNPVPVWFLGLSATVLLLACATAANLMLAENVRRRRELAVRLALGASPRRLMSAQLLESGLISLTATGGALLFGAASVALVRLLPLPPIGPLIGWHNVVLAAALALGTPLLFGTIPALWSARRDAGDVFRKAVGTPAAIATQRRMMAAQIGVAFALMVVGGLFFRSLSLLLAFDTGADLDHVLSIRSNPVAQLPDVELAEPGDYADVVRGVPGVVDVSVASAFFASGAALFRVMDGRADTLSRAGANIIGPDYFQVTGIPVVAGRALGDLDRLGTPPVAMVSADLAEQLWPGTSPLGSCVRLRYVLALPYGDACIEVVGVAGATRTLDSRGEVQGHPTLYLSANQAPTSSFDAPLYGRGLLVRTAGDPEAMIAPLRARIQAADPEMPFLQIASAKTVLRRNMGRWEIAAKLFGAFGAVATLLVGIGLYGLVAFMVAQREREMGIRAALGAGRGRLVRLVLLDGLRVSAIGLVVGSVLGLALGRILQSRLYGLSYADPRTYGMVALGLAVLAAIASLHPAVRASGADPVRVLHSE